MKKSTKPNALLMVLFFLSISLAGCFGESEGTSGDEELENSDDEFEIPLVERTTEHIKLVESRILELDNNTSAEISFYRNEAYTCGLSGHYTFFVMEPINNPGTLRLHYGPILHGGGYGWFDENQTYQTVKTHHSGYLEP